MKTFLVTVCALFLLAMVPGAAEAARCIGKPAKVIARSGSLTVDRYDSVVLTGKKVNVFATGDNRICSTGGDIKLRFGKGSQNRAALGSGNDLVKISSKARANHIDLGDGNNRIRIKNKAVTNSVKAGKGNDRILLAYRTNNAIIDAGAGDNEVVLAAKASSQEVTTGNGDDVVRFTKAAETNKRMLRTGLGNDRVNIVGLGNTTAYISEKQNPKGLEDTDYYRGNRSNDTVYDYQGGVDLEPNRIYGEGGFDKINSLGTARSDIYGGNGTDWIYAASDGDSGDRIFGERGNDRLNADRGSENAHGAFLDGGSGDDWLHGTAGNDTMIALSGIKKIYGYRGDDTVIKTGIGIGTIVGGDGYDTISYVAHTPPGFGQYSGVMVDLSESRGTNGRGIDTINGIEHLIGSPFDDLLTGNEREDNEIDGGLGNDNITAFSGDEVDGGLGQNECEGGKQARCNDSSPGNASGGRPILDIGQEGILTVIGSNNDDEIEIGYDMIGGAYLVDLNRTPMLSGDCVGTPVMSRYRCPAPHAILSTVTVNGGNGDDRITSNYSIPAEVTSVLSGGAGEDKITGGKNRDFIQTAEKVDGRGSGDQIYMSKGANIKAGVGSDTVHIHNPCQGGFVSGGAGNRDGAVFAGADYGVEASLTSRKAKWKDRGCANPIRFADDFEGLEGTKHDDKLIGRAKGTGKTTFLGRDGADRFIAKNGIRDTVTTGGGGKRNKVIADRFDKVVWGWGLAAY
jgi:Ca2+-binding RTX toxin-like protein